jgi:hypothetical protein
MLSQALHSPLHGVRDAEKKVRTKVALRQRGCVRPNYERTKGYAVCGAHGVRKLGAPKPRQSMLVWAVRGGLRVMLRIRVSARRMSAGERDRAFRRSAGGSEKAPPDGDSPTNHLNVERTLPSMGTTRHAVFVSRG